MTEVRADTRLSAGLGLPPPPYRLRHARSRAWFVAGCLAVAGLAAAGIGVLVAYYGFTTTGRGLIVDSALAAGFGTTLPDAQVVPGECAYEGSRAGSRMPGQWRCVVHVTAAGEQVDLPITTVGWIENLQALGAGRIWGVTGVRWSFGTLAARWWNDAPLLLIGFGLIAIAAMASGWMRDAWRLLHITRGVVADVDLLTWQGRPWFAFVDAGGVRRFERSAQAMTPLILDGVRTVGAALVHGRAALLLGANLSPLMFEEARRMEIQARVTQVQRQGQVRALLPPQQGDPGTLAGRIERIEQRLAGRPKAGELGRLYDQAWRLVWDSNDAAIADRALAARDAIARRLGPAATFAALEACRRRYAAG
ncbi:MAG: hypothetical protein WDN25_18380 [Acetobacteraceae bacterium]